MDNVKVTVELTKEELEFINKYLSKRLIALTKEK